MNIPYKYDRFVSLKDNLLRTRYSDDILIEKDTVISVGRIQNSGREPEIVISIHKKYNPDLQSTYVGRTFQCLIDDVNQAQWLKL